MERYFHIVMVFVPISSIPEKSRLHYDNVLELLSSILLQSFICWFFVSSGYERWKPKM